MIIKFYVMNLYIIKNTLKFLESHLIKIDGFFCVIIVLFIGENFLEM